MAWSHCQDGDLMPLGVPKLWHVSAFSFLGLQDTCLPGVSWASGHWYWVPGHGPIHPKGLGLFQSRDVVALSSVADCQPRGNLKGLLFLHSLPPATPEQL